MFLEPFGSNPDCRDGMQCHSLSPLCAEDVKGSPKQDPKGFPPHPTSGALMCGAINMTFDSSVAQAGVFGGWASPPGAGEGCWGLMQGTFLHHRSLWNSSLALSSIGEPTALSQCSLKPCTERTWIIFPSQGVGLGSLPPALGFVTWPCPAGISIFLRQEGAGCGKSLPWGG